jgi:hypothetical protein
LLGKKWKNGTNSRENVNNEKNSKKMKSKNWVKKVTFNE